MRIQCTDKILTITIAHTRRERDKRVKRNAWIAVDWAVMQHEHYIVHSTYYCPCYADENQYLMTRTNHWPSIVMPLRTTRVRVTARQKIPCLFMNLSASQLLSRLHMTQLIILVHNLLIRFRFVPCNILFFLIKGTWKANVERYNDSKHKRKIF